jgi:adenosylhomocysteine nucleosidase
MRLLILASEPFELAGLLSHASNVRRAAMQVDWARTARLGSHELLLVANGAGPHRAAAALETALPRFNPDALVSAGLCGALSPELKPTDIVVAAEVIHGEAHYPTAELDCSRPHSRGVVRTIDHVAQTAQEKGVLFRDGAVAVEMEAGAVAATAQTAGLPFFCIKAVSDLANETLENDLNTALRPDGHFDTIKILGSTLRRPLVRVPELLRLWRRSARAADSLGDFFADCRF